MNNIYKEMKIFVVIGKRFFIYKFKKNIFLLILNFSFKILLFIFIFINNKFYVFVFGCDVVGYFSIEFDVSVGG